MQQKITVARQLTSQNIVDEGFQELQTLCPAMAKLAREGVNPKLRQRTSGLEGLISIIISQQVSVASAAAIYKRVEQHFGLITAQAIRAATDEDMQACGLSAPKRSTLRAIADEILEHDLDLEALGSMTAEDAHHRLITIKGIGPWTAEIYLLFCLGHPDIFPAGDLALQEAAKIALEYPDRPNTKDLILISERWKPWRSIAAKALWAYYNDLKSRPGI